MTEWPFCQVEDQSKAFLTETLVNLPCCLLQNSIGNDTHVLGNKHENILYSLFYHIPVVNLSWIFATQHRETNGRQWNPRISVCLLLLSDLCALNYSPCRLLFMVDRMILKRMRSCWVFVWILHWLFIGSWIVSPLPHNMSRHWVLEPVNLTLLGNKVIVIKLVKMRSSWS